MGCYLFFIIIGVFFYFRIYLGVYCVVAVLFLSIFCMFFILSAQSFKIEVDLLNMICFLISRLYFLVSGHLSKICSCVSSCCLHSRQVLFVYLFL